MDPQVENLIQKRKQDEDISEQNKRKKLKTPEPPEEADGVAKITDVIDDCLEHIFGYLKLQDLINIAETCKRFKSSVQLAFTSKCKGKVMKLCYDPYSSNRLQPITLTGNTIDIWDLSNCLKVLRHFGNLITKLDIYYFNMIRNQSAILAQYMNEYCADSLIDISMKDATKEVLANWTKPFTNAESIEIFKSDLGDLNVWFPKMRCLLINYGSQFIPNKFPHLEDLRIHSIDCNDGIKMKVAKLLRLGQLEKLQLKVRNHAIRQNKNLLDFIRQNPSLTKLTIYTKDEFNTFTAEQIKINSTAEFEGLEVELKPFKYGLSPASIDF